MDLRASPNGSNPKRQSTAALQNLSDSRSTRETPQGFGVRLPL
jgi:hypothetical protein